MDKPVYRPSFKAWLSLVGFWTILGVVTFAGWFLIGMVTR